MRAILLASALVLAATAAQASHFNKPTCGWWLPHEGDRPINLGPCPIHLPYGTSATITLPDGSVVTVPVGGGGDKPGHGYGDTNHTHSGPPGQNK